MNDALPRALKATRSFTTGHAIVIGVANYTNVSPLPDSILNDARDVAAVLKSKEYCGFDQLNVHLLLDGDATLDGIRGALDFVARTSGPDDTIVIFFSGHGARLGTLADPESALLPVDCDPQEIDTTSLSEPEFSAALQRFAAQRLLVLIDACYSAGAGVLKSGGKEEPPDLGYSEKSLERLAQGTGRVLIASSRATEKSIVLLNARNSVFTTHLLDALHGKAKTSEGGVIRVFEIFNHISEMVKRQVPDRQHPVFKANDLEDNFPVALYRGGIKSASPLPAFAEDSVVWSELGKIMPDLYPVGPMDQEIWERAGGDSSRLHLNDTGRTAWFKALRTLRHGGGGSTISREKLIRTALEDYPHHPMLSALL
ncbi:MAG: caspase family protein [Gammaproteobacteria bacterium]|nr:caspase family protein [Gammaproteobacteria bacterium]